MSAGALTLFDSTLNGLLRGTVPPLDVSPFTALLLAPGYVPDTAAHSVFADVEAFELKATDAVRLLLTGTMVTGAAFHSDDLMFGDPISIGPVRHMALVAGNPGGLVPSSMLIGVADLAPAGGALEAQRGRFAVTAPAAGWFSLARL